MKSLDFVIGTAKKDPGSHQNDLWNYQNRARLLFQEITHLNYFVNAPDKSPYVDDVKKSSMYKTGKRKKNATVRKASRFSPITRPLAAKGATITPSASNPMFPTLDTNYI